MKRNVKQTDILQTKTLNGEVFIYDVIRMGTGIYQIEEGANLVSFPKDFSAPLSLFVQLVDPYLIEGVVEASLNGDKFYRFSSMSADWVEISGELIE